MRSTRGSSEGHEQDTFIHTLLRPPRTTTLLKADVTLGLSTAVQSDCRMSSLLPQRIPLEVRLAFLSASQGRKKPRPPTQALQATDVQRWRWPVGSHISIKPGWVDGWLRLGLLIGHPKQRSCPHIRELMGVQRHL